MKKKLLLALTIPTLMLMFMGAAVLGYQDWQLRGSAPGNPASGFLRTWADNTAGAFKCLTSAGAGCYWSTNYAGTYNTGILPVANGGSGSSSPSLVAGTNVTITGSWPNQTVAASGGGGGTTWPFTFSMPASGWSWFNQNVGGSVNTVDTSNSKITLTSNGGAEGLAGYQRSKIASTFTITAALNLTAPFQTSTSNYSEFGIFVTDGTKTIAYGVLLFNSLSIYLSGYEWTNATTPSASAVPISTFTTNGTLGTQVVFLGFPLFLRITETASNRSYYVSSDYTNWLLLGSTSNTDFLTTSTYGVFIRAKNVSFMGTAYSFAETNP